MKRLFFMFVIFVGLLACSKASSERVGEATKEERQSLSSLQSFEYKPAKSTEDTFSVEPNKELDISHFDQEYTSFNYKEKTSIDGIVTYKGSDQTMWVNNPSSGTVGTIYHQKVTAQTQYDLPYEYKIRSSVYQIPVGYKIKTDTDTLKITDTSDVEEENLKLNRIYFGKSEPCEVEFKVTMNAMNPQVTVESKPCSFELMAYDTTGKAHIFTGQIASMKIDLVEAFQNTLANPDAFSELSEITGKFFNASGERIGFYKYNPATQKLTFLDNNKDAF